MTTPQKRLDDLRAELAELKTSAAEVERPLLPLPDVAPRCDALLSHLAAMGVGSLGVAALASRASFTGPLIQTPRGNLGPVSHEDLAHLHNSVVGLLVALHPSQFRELLDAALDRAYAAQPPGLPLEARATELARLAARGRELEIEEERLIRAAEAEGIALERRADASPEIVLARHLGDLLPSPAPRKRA